jgi:DNA modification methylase
MAQPILPLNQILHGDCLKHLKTLPNASVDLVFADPPYNLQLSNDLWRPDMTKVDAVDDAWDRFESLSAYDAFTRAWLAECQRILKPTGTLWVIGTYHNIYRVGAQLMDLGYWILNEVIWHKTNPMPQFRGVRFTNAHETLIWAKPAREGRYTFNYHAMKHLNGGKQMRSTWALPICNGKERIRENGEKAHSTQKPEALLERVLLASSNPGDIVLDPFFGSGTTGAVAKRLQRHWIGIERESAYVRIATRRIEQIMPAALPELPQGKRQQARIPLRQVIEAGLIPAGETLYFQSRSDQYAELLEDGKIQYHQTIGSIHRIGREIMGSATCNGWEHWYFEDSDGSLQPLDVLRQRLRATQEPS